MKIGDYVRTKYGFIAKYIIRDTKYNFREFDGYIRVNYEDYDTEVYDDDYDEFLKEEVVEINEKMINLIKSGDYVNGHKVLKIFENKENGNRLLIIGINDDANSDSLTDYMSSEYEFIYDEDIKTRLTKERINFMEYKVGEE